MLPFVLSGSGIGCINVASRRTLKIATNRVRQDPTSLGVSRAIVNATLDPDRAFWLNLPTGYRHYYSSGQLLLDVLMEAAVKQIGTAFPWRIPLFSLLLPVPAIGRPDDHRVCRLRGLLYHLG